MKTAYSIWGVAKADFTERVRRFSFVGFCALCVFFTFWFVPRPKGFTALVIDPDVFVQGADPSWVPMSAAMCGGMMLCIFGFVYIINSVGHDRESGVLSLIYTSPTRRSSYLFGKLISNTLLLACLLAAVMSGAFLIMEIRFPGRFISLWDFFSPFLCVVPGLVFVSAFALLMESAPVFRRKSGLSITLFFCLYITIISLAAMNINPYRLISVFDFSGYLWMHDSISAAAFSVTGRALNQISLFTNSHSTGANLKILSFSGLMPSLSYLFDKLALLIISILVTYFASLLLPKRENSILLTKKIGKTSSKTKNRFHTSVPVCRFGLLRAEMRKMLAEQTIFLWISAAGMYIACLFSPIDIVKNTLLALLFALLIPVFSKMGCLEYQSGMAGILHTIPGAMIRQAFACWLTGAAISLTAALPALVRLICLSDAAGFLSVLIFSLFVPSLALFVGELTASSRAFEILMLIACFFAVNISGFLAADRFSVSSVTRMVSTVFLILVMLFLTLCKRKFLHP